MTFISVLSTLCEPWMCWREVFVFSFSSCLPSHLEGKKEMNCVIKLHKNACLILWKISEMTHLRQPRFVEKMLDCLALRVPSQMLDWKSSESWAREHGLTRHSLHRCLLQAEPTAFLLDSQEHLEVTIFNSRKTGFTGSEIQYNKTIISPNKHTHHQSRYCRSSTKRTCNDEVICDCTNLIICSSYNSVSSANDHITSCLLRPWWGCNLWLGYTTFMIVTI